MPASNLWCAPPIKKPGLADRADLGGRSEGRPFFSASAELVEDDATQFVAAQSDLLGPPVRLALGLHRSHPGGSLVPGAVLGLGLDLCVHFFLSLCLDMRGLP